MTETEDMTNGVAIRFPGWEAMMAGRGSLFVPDRSILAAHAQPGWSSEILGMRSGLVISGYRKLGTFRHPSGMRRLVSMQRGMPLLRLETVRDDTGFDEILLSTPEAAAIAARIQARVMR